MRATFYEDLAGLALTRGALEAFREQAVPETEVDVHDVPGAFELSLAAKACAESGRYAGVACLGAVIRGETDHYDYVWRPLRTGSRESSSIPAYRARSES